MATTVEQIKSRLSIVDVVQGYVKLQKAGANFKARCPFHQEKTPSFFVSPARESFMCFGCSKGGDIFTFVEEIEGVEFFDALKILADRAGVEIAHRDPQERSDRQMLLQLLDDATAYYESNLVRRADVGEYLVGRGVTGVTAKQFRVGYALPEWDGVLNYLKSKGYSETQAEKVGLVTHGHDRFRGRITFPLADAMGRVVGFSGRVFEPDAGENSGGKYINTPDTPLYDKSRLLYGFHRAKETIRKCDLVILVEGQMDVVLSHQAGAEHAVAVSGTALTDQHLDTITRFTDNIALAFDTDEAGFRATERAVPLALARGMNVSAIPIAGGKDAADLVRDDPESWKRAIEGRVDIISFFLRHAGEAHKDDRRAMIRAITEQVIPYVARIPNAMDVSHYVQEIDRALSIGEEAIWKEVQKAQRGSVRTGAEDGEPAPRTAGRIAVLERRLIGLALWRGFDSSPEIASLVGERLASLTDRERSSLAMEAEFVYAGGDLLDAERDSLVCEITRERLKAMLREKERALKDAESSGDHARARAYLEECHALVRELTRER